VVTTRPGADPRLVRATVQTPLGALHCFAERPSGALCGVYFDDHRPAPPAALAARLADAVSDPAGSSPVAEQFEAYFAGEADPFTVPIAPAGTAFQRAVWQALRRIPYGHTVSYGALAAAAGRPGAVRAAGAANARNPLSIVVPCHRVVGRAGALTGYAGGLAAKRQLLELERSALCAGSGRP
jgi:methylated-DNA-[protein]-cysteine S-methyltransferase